MSRKALFAAHWILRDTSTFGLWSVHSPTSHPRSLSWADARDGRSVTWEGRSRALSMSHLSPTLFQTTAYRLESLVPVGVVISIVPSCRATSGRRNLSECWVPVILLPLMSGRGFLNSAAIWSFPRVVFPDSSM